MNRVQALVKTQFAVEQEIREVYRALSKYRPKVSYGRKVNEYKETTFFPIFDDSEELDLRRRLSELQLRSYQLRQALEACQHAPNGGLPNP